MILVVVVVVVVVSGHSNSVLTAASTNPSGRGARLRRGVPAEACPVHRLLRPHGQRGDAAELARLDPALPSMQPCLAPVVNRARLDAVGQQRRGRLRVWQPDQGQYIWC